MRSKWKGSYMAIISPCSRGSVAFKGFPFHPTAGGVVVKNQLIPALNCTVSQPCCWFLESKIFFYGYTVGGGEQHSAPCHALHKAAIIFLLSPPFTTIPAEMAAVASEPSLLLYHMEAKFNPTFRPVFLTGVSRGFLRTS